MGSNTHTIYSRSRPDIFRVKSSNYRRKVPRKVDIFIHENTRLSTAAVYPHADEYKMSQDLMPKTKLFRRTPCRQPQLILGSANEHAERQGQIKQSLADTKGSHPYKLGPLPFEDPREPDSWRFDSFCEYYSQGDFVDQSIAGIEKLAKRPHPLNQNPSQPSRVCSMGDLGPSTHAPQSNIDVDELFLGKPEGQDCTDTTIEALQTTDPSFLARVRNRSSGIKLVSNNGPENGTPSNFPELLDWPSARPQRAGRSVSAQNPARAPQPCEAYGLPRERLFEPHPSSEEVDFTRASNIRGPSWSHQQPLNNRQSPDFQKQAAEESASRYSYRSYGKDPSTLLHPDNATSGNTTESAQLSKAPDNLLQQELRHDPRPYLYEKHTLPHDPNKETPRSPRASAKTPEKHFYTYLEFKALREERDERREKKIQYQKKHHSVG